MNRDFKVKIETEEAFFADLMAQAVKIDQGIIPEKTVERVSFPDLETFYRYCTPKRLQLLQELHKVGCISINALAKHLQRHYKNVFRDVKTLESAWLVEKTATGKYCVPWDELTATVRRLRCAVWKTQNRSARRYREGFENMLNPWLINTFTNLVQRENLNGLPRHAGC